MPKLSRKQTMRRKKPRNMSKRSLNKKVSRRRVNRKKRSNRKSRKKRNSLFGGASPPIMFTKFVRQDAVLYFFLYGDKLPGSYKNLKTIKTAKDVPDRINMAVFEQMLKGEREADLVWLPSSQVHDPTAMRLLPDQSMLSLNTYPIYVIPYDQIYAPTPPKQISYKEWVLETIIKFVLPKIYNIKILGLFDILKEHLIKIRDTISDEHKTKLCDEITTLLPKHLKGAWTAPKMGPTPSVYEKGLIELRVNICPEPPYYWTPTETQNTPTRP